MNLRVDLRGRVGLGLPAPPPVGRGWCGNVEGDPPACHLCTCPRLHGKSIASLGLSEVQGVGRILSEAMSCLDKLDSPWQLSMGWSRWVEAEKKKLGGLFAEEEEEEGGLFALWSIIFHLQRNNSSLSPFTKHGITRKHNL